MTYIELKKIDNFYCPNCNGKNSFTAVKVNNLFIPKCSECKEYDNEEGFDDKDEALHGIRTFYSEDVVGDYQKDMSTTSMSET